MSEQYGTVEAVERLSPSMIRVVFGGAGLAGFEPTDQTDQYVNALFVPDGAPYSVPFDPDEVRSLEPEFRPKGRRYTIRAWDPETRRVTIDFVAHGDVGFAGRWAQRAQVGDRLQMVGPSGGYRPNTDADWYLMVGDESALPAIAASLDVVPPGRRCVVLAVVDDADHEIDLGIDAGIDTAGAGDVEVRWCHRVDGTPTEQRLVDEIARLDWSGNVDIFVHGEAAEVRAVRRFLVAERGVDRSGCSISPYWRRGKDDEGWREIKREWIADDLVGV
ncbi:MAG: NADPH-dependent ferric siderophore reductase [Acidimicrobiaceae bacterium]|nr:NADPH-dependent ferric siderophore reductase [Acidimicrobiaceae bacterium]